MLCSFPVDIFYSQRGDSKSFFLYSEVVATVMGSETFDRFTYDKHSLQWCGQVKRDVLIDMITIFKLVMERLKIDRWYRK